MINLGEALDELSKAFVKAYDGSVLVTVVTTDVAHTRRAIRSTDNEDANASGNEGAEKPKEKEVWFVKIVKYYTLVHLTPSI